MKAYPKAGSVAPGIISADRWNIVDQVQLWLVGWSGNRLPKVLGTGKSAVRAWEDAAVTHALPRLERLSARIQSDRMAQR